MKGLNTLSKTEIQALNIPENIRNCPFCNAEVFIGKHQYHKGAYIVRCSSSGINCLFFPSSGTLDFNEVAIYIKQWNERI